MKTENDVGYATNLLEDIIEFENEFKLATLPEEVKAIDEMRVVHDWLMWVLGKEPLYGAISPQHFIKMAPGLIKLTDLLVSLKQEFEFNEPPKTIAA